MKTAVCAVMKDEAWLVRDWIAYHLAVGFDCCIIYDNASSDGAAEMARAAGRGADVRVVEWPRSDHHYQVAAIADAAARFAAEFDWIAFIDADEFVFSPTGEAIPEVLSRYAGQSAVVLNWAMFGSSGHVERPSGLVIENYLHRAPDHFGPNAHCKTIARPSTVGEVYNSHFMSIAGPVVNVLSEPPGWQNPGVTVQIVLSPLRVNHYFTRSLVDWDLKIRRGYPDGLRKADEFAAYDRNEVRDEGMLRHLPAVSELWAKLWPQDPPPTA